jgi:hypothetical protein
MAMSPEHKYAVAGAHLDQLSIRFGDGKEQGPGPAHYDSVDKAFKDAAKWLWVFAEASVRIGRRSQGHSIEWDAFVFQDLSTKQYGFTTPEPHGHDYAEAVATRARQIRRTRGYKLRAYIHSHRSGLLAMGDTSQTFSRIGVLENGAIDGDLAAAYMFAALFPTEEVWVGLVTPTGALKRVRLLKQVRTEIERVREKEAPRPTMMPTRAVLSILLRQRHRVFFEEPVPFKREEDWHWPPETEDWRKQAIDAAARELMYRPRNRREARRFDRIRSAGDL